MTEKTVTLTEEAYKSLKDLADLTLKVANDKKTRKQFVKAVKEIEPDRRFPDVEMDDLREEMKAEREAEKLEREKEKILARQTAQKEALKTRYDDKAIEEIEKIMEKKGISDYEDGAILYGATIKPAAPTYEAKDHTWEMPKIDIKDFGSIQQRRRSSLMGAVDEVIRNRK